MNKSTFAEALKKMEASLSERLVGFSSESVRKMTMEIKGDLETEYNYFFQLISDEVIGKLSTPGLLSGYTTWKPLTAKWAFQKQKFGGYPSGMEHYTGLSKSFSRGKALGRSSKGGNTIGMSRLRANGPKPKGLVKVGAFADYIATLRSQGTTERFFGPISIGYDFISPDPNIRVYMQGKDGYVNRVQVASATRGGFIAFPKTMKMVATITAFGKLKGVTFNEKNVVDFIIKRIDPANEKQWVKINSSYGIGKSNRPIRAIVTPILRYYIEKSFADVVRTAVKSRSR